MAGRSTTGIMWFRRDLRLADNPALIAAVDAHQEVVPLFVVDPALWGPAGANRRAFLAGCLADLRDRTGGRLVIRSGRPAEVLADVAREVSAGSVWCAEDFGPYGRRRDNAAEQALAGHDVTLERVGSPYAVPPGTVLTGTGGPFKVFTPFSRAWRAHGWDDPRQPPARPRWATGLKTGPLPVAPDIDADLPDPGEPAGLHRLESFLDGAVHDYANRRNRADGNGTSRLSPYLKWGCVHPRQALCRLGASKGEQVFGAELCWREFYADVLFHRPDTARRAYHDAMGALPVDSGPEADECFRAWCEGRTGYPIVDAGMRQLQTEGWVHNRVRMIVASFLVKDLHVDWTRGARWFMHHLVDADLASNQHGWQWVAGTGTDSAPYFRIFNPVTQATKFDPDGTYVRRFVPELADLDAPAIHAPWKADVTLFEAGASNSTYPPPIVDHATERQESLRRYQNLRRAT